MTSFFMICRKPTHRNARTEPKARYPHVEVARDEARKLARQTGHAFVILSVIEEVQPRDDLTDRLPLL